MKKIEDVSWEDVEAEWRREEDNEIWRDFYNKKGFADWEEWRWARKMMLRLPGRQWSIYIPENSVVEASQMYCDASTRWTDFYSDREKSTFAHLKDHDFFTSHSRVLDIRRCFPEESQMIVLSSGAKSIVVDGHHRAVALAGMDKKNAPYISMAVAHIEENDFQRFYRGGKLIKAERRLMDVIGLTRSRIRELKKIC